MQIEELGHNGHSRVEKLVCQQLSWAGDMTGGETRLLTSHLRKTCLRKHLRDYVEKLSGSAFVTAPILSVITFLLILFLS